jgi:hypothetical protein
MPYLGRRGVFIPILVSLWYLIRLWREAEFYGWKEILFPSGSLSRLAQVALAIVLVLKAQIDSIY